MKQFKNVLVYVEGEGLKKRDLTFSDRILSTGEEDAEEKISLPADAIVVPAFIDEHIHGAGGADAMDGSVQALSRIADTLVKEGTASFLATTMTQSRENLIKAMNAVKEYRAENRLSGARLLGVHLEGPFISPRFKGAQPLEHVVSPSREAFEAYMQASGNAVKIVTLAPETEGAAELIESLSACGITVSLGHTAAKFADIERAVRAGAKNVTHTYNAQSPLHHRDIGTVGSALLLDELNCELIADTVHVSLPAIKLLFKNKPAEKLTLITDAMRAKGLGDCVSELGGQTVYVKNSEARLQDGTLAGSVLCMNRAVQNLVEKAGVPFLSAVDCATKNPALSLGIYGETGSICKGKRADLTVLNARYDVLYTVRGGEIVYSAQRDMA